MMAGSFSSTKHQVNSRADATSQRADVVCEAEHPDRGGVGEGVKSLGDVAEWSKALPC